MSIDFARLRQQIQIVELLSWMSWNPTQSRGQQLRGPCPLCQLTNDDFSLASHRSHSHCFSVNTRRNIFRCFRCNRSGNALELWALYHGISIYSAACEIQHRLGLAAHPSIKQPPKASHPASKQASNRSASHPAKLAQFLTAIDKQE